MLRVLVRREESGVQGVWGYEEVGKSVQKPGGSSTGRNPGEAGDESKVAAVHMWDAGVGETHEVFDVLVPGSTSISVNSFSGRA